MKKMFILASIALISMACTNSNSTKSMNALEAISTRVSVRQFTGDKPSADQIDQLLRAAMAAPSAVNRQPWCFIVIDDEATLKQIGEQFPSSRVQNGAKLCIVPCGDLTKALEGEAQDYWIQDVSAATQNLLLAAHAMGLGAVWTGLYPINQRYTDAQKLLRLPDYIVPLCFIPVGTPAEQPNVKNKYQEGNIHYNRW